MRIHEASIGYTMRPCLKKTESKIYSCSKVEMPKGWGNGTVDKALALWSQLLSLTGHPEDHLRGRVYSGSQFQRDRVHPGEKGTAAGREGKVAGAGGCGQHITFTPKKQMVKRKWAWHKA